MKHIVNFLYDVYSAIERARVATELTRNGKWSEANRVMLQGQ